MHKNRRVKGTASTIPAGIGIGVLISMLMTFIGVAVTAYMTASEIISESAAGIATAFILIVSAALGALITIMRIQRKRMQISLLTGLCYFLSLLAMTALFFGGQYSAIGVSGLCVLCGSGCIAIAATVSEKKQNNRKRKYPYR